MKEYIKTTDYFLSMEQFTLVKDETLDMLLTTPIPENLASYYETENYISYKKNYFTFEEKLYSYIKQINLKKKEKLAINTKTDQKRLLDIGCATGDFLHYASQKNWHTTGVEPNDKAREIAKKRNLSIYKNLDSLPLDRKYSTITLWHVLEHMPNLPTTIKTILSLLEENGKLIIAVPNFKSYDALHYKKYWAAYDVPRHLYHFSQKSIRLLFEEYNYQIVATKPLWFDSFYVSLLSEKYKGSKLKYIKAFYHGLLSNLSAIRSGEYSSLIYIISKK